LKAERKDAAHNRHGVALLDPGDDRCSGRHAAKGIKNDPFLNELKNGKRKKKKRPTRKKSRTGRQHGEKLARNGIERGGGGGCDDWRKARDEGPLPRLVNIRSTKETPRQKHERMLTRGRKERPVNKERGDDGKFSPG